MPAETERLSINGSRYCCPLCEAGRTFSAAREAGDWKTADEAYNWLFELKAESETDLVAQLDAMKDEHDRLREVIRTAHAHWDADRDMKCGKTLILAMRAWEAADAR